MLDIITFALAKQEIASKIKTVGADFDFTYETETGTITFSLKNKAGQIIDSKSVTIPTAAIIKRGYYDADTKEIVLVLADPDETEIRIPIGDLLKSIEEKIDNEILRAKAAEELLANTKQDLLIANTGIVIDDNIIKLDLTNIILDGGNAEIIG